MATVLTYLRYLVALLLTGALFYGYSLKIQQSTIRRALDKKLPMVIDKRGFEITIHSIDLLDISRNIVESKVDTSIRISNLNKLGKFLPKKSMRFSILSKTTPRLHGKFLSFEVLSLKINRFIKRKQVKGILKRKLESIKIPIKKLENISWFASAKDIRIQDDGVLLIDFRVSKLLIVFLVPLLLLREIGLFLIILYQKFLSPRKKYRCARGELYGDGTCSSITKEAFEKDGFIAGIKAYRKTTKRCKEAYETLKKKKKRDGGTCDYCAGCSGCDAGSCGGGDIVGSSCDSVPCSCDVVSC